MPDTKWLKQVRSAFLFQMKVWVGTLKLTWYSRVLRHRILLSHVLLGGMMMSSVFLAEEHMRKTTHTMFLKEESMKVK